MPNVESVSGPDISVLIPTYRDGALLPLCLAALRAQTLEASKFEIIVINNDPGRPLSTENWPTNARLIVEPKTGSYAARNAGIAIARGRFLAFTDADCVPDQTWLANGLAALEQNLNSRVTGPIPIFQVKGAGKYAYLYDFHVAFRQRESAMRGECVTANLFVAAEAFSQLGLFDSSLMSGGDFEWNRRAHAAGVPLLFQDDIIVRHPSRSRLSELFIKRRRTARSEAKILAVSTWGYVKPRLKPPINSLVLDRAPVSPSERTALIGIRWALNLWGAWQFSCVRLGLTAPTRS